MSPPGPLCYCWPRSWLRLTPPPDMTLGLPGRWELRAAAMASAATSDGWPTMCLPSGCQVPACTSWPLRTSSTRPWRWVVLFGLRKVVFWQTWQMMDVSPAADALAASNPAAAAAASPPDTSLHVVHSFQTLNLLFKSALPCLMSHKRQKCFFFTTEEAFRIKSETSSS